MSMIIYCYIQTHTSTLYNSILSIHKKSNNIYIIFFMYVDIEASRSSRIQRSGWLGRKQGAVRQQVDESRGSIWISIEF